MDASAAHRVVEALRFLARAGIVDYNGHASVRVAGGFAINTAASNRAAMTEAMVCVVDLEGAAIEGDRPPNEVHLHAAIYRGREAVAAVVHGHPKWLGTLSAAGRSLAPVLPQGVLVSDLPTYPFAHSISTRERGDAVARTLGTAAGAVLAGHGIVLAGADLVETSVLALYAEQTAERQVRAAPLGGARALSADEIEEYRRTLGRPALYAKCWDFTLAGGA